MNSAGLIKEQNKVGRAVGNLGACGTLVFEGQRPNGVSAFYLAAESPYESRKSPPINSINQQTAEDSLGLDITGKS